MHVIYLPQYLLGRKRSVNVACRTNNNNTGTSLELQWLRLHAPNAGGMGLIPGWGTKVPHASQRWCGQKKEKNTIILCLNSEIDLDIWRVVEKEGKGMWIYTVVVQSLHHVWLFAAPWTATHQASLSFPVSWSLLRLMSIESVMPSNHLIPLPPFPSTVSLSQHQGLFSELTLCIRWPKYWNFSFSINPSNKYSVLISFRID